VIVGLLRRSVGVVSRWIGRIALCGLVGLAGCGQRSSAGVGGADTAATASAASTIAETSTTGTVTGTVTSTGMGTTTTGTVGSGGGIRPAQQTDPVITPIRGGPQTVFVVHLTSRTRLGVHGVVSAVYRVTARGPVKQRCEREATWMVDRGAVGQRLAGVWHPEAAGWCIGTWRGQVLLEVGPHCARGPTTSQARACPEFASRLIEVGRFEWRVL
jgi:hypothetical protein